jgi:hypothetical protein
MGRLIGGLNGGDEGPGSGLCLLRHHGLPRFRALPGGGETPTSCLLRIDRIVSITVLLELFELQEEERDRIPQTKGPGPLYRRGTGYRLGGIPAGCRLLGGHVLGVILSPCSDRSAL